MSKTARVYGRHHAVTCKSHAKARRGSHHFSTGKYQKRWAIVKAHKERNRAKAQAALAAKLSSYREGSFFVGLV